MPNPDDNLPALTPLASIERTHGFAAAVDRRATWAGQLATRRPIGSGDIGAELVHRFTGMGTGTIGLWAARLAERYGAGERAADRPPDLPLASTPALRRVARTSSAGAWAPQLARQLADTRSGDSAPDLARSFASDLSARGWPVQSGAGAPPGARQANASPLQPSALRASAAPPTQSSATAGVGRVMPILDGTSPSTASPRPQSEPSAASLPSAEIGQPHAHASAPPTLSRLASPPEVQEPAGSALHAGANLAADTTHAHVSRDYDMSAEPAGSPAAVQPAQAALAPVPQERASRSNASAQTVAGALRSNVPLALPLVTQRPTGLFRQAALDPLARMGFRTAQPLPEPPTRIGVASSSALARSAAPTLAVPPAPAQTARPLANVPAAETQSLAANTPDQRPLPELHPASSRAPDPTPISARLDSPPVPVAGRPVPGVLAASIAQRLAAPTSATAAQLPALRTWAPGPSAAPRGSVSISPGSLSNIGTGVSAALQIARATELAPMTRPAIVPPVATAPAIQSHAQSDLSAPQSSHVPQEPAAPAQPRGEPPAEQIEWGSLPLVHRALEHTAALSASASASAASLPSQIVGRQAAFAPAALAAADAASQAAQRAPGQAEAPVADRMFVAPPHMGASTVVFEQPGMSPAGRLGGEERETWPTPELPLRDRPSVLAARSSYMAQRLAAELPLAPRGAARAAVRSGSPAMYLSELGGAPEPGAFPSALQRAPALDAAGASPTPAGSSATPAAGAAPAAASPPIDELARKVYDYLRRELRIEQERAGWRTW